MRWRTLIYHLNRPAKSAPGPAIRTVHMAGSVDIGSPLVQGRVDHETGCVDGPVAAADPVALLIDVNHVRDLEHAKVHAVGVDPERFWLNGVCLTSISKRKGHSRNSECAPLRLMCPLLPSENPSFAKMRKAAAICSSCH